MGTASFDYLSKFMLFYGKRCRKVRGGSSLFSAIKATLDLDCCWHDIVTALPHVYVIIRVHVSCRLQRVSQLCYIHARAGARARLIEDDINRELLEGVTFSSHDLLAGFAIALAISPSSKPS